MLQCSSFLPLCSGELLLDQQRFEDAIRNFDEAIEIEKKK